MQPLLVAGLLAQLALHLLEPALPVTWGYAHLSRRPELLWVALLVVVALPPLGGWSWRRLEGKRLRPWRPARVAIVLAVAALLLAALSVWAPMRPLSIDPAIFRLWLVRGEVNPRSDLWLRLLLLVADPLTPWVVPWRTALAVVGVLGAVTMASLVGAARRLARDRAEALAMALLVCTAFGIVRMSFGVTDVYPASLALMALFFWTALRTLDGDGHPAWPLLIGATGMFWAMGLFLLVPAALVLLLDELRQAARRRRALVGACVAALGAGLATVPSTGRAFAFGGFLDAVAAHSSPDLGGSPGVLYSPDVLFSRQHFYDVLNAGLMVDGVGILCSLTAGVWLACRLVRTRSWDVRAVMLGGTAAGQLLYLGTFELLLSPATMWDLFSFGSVATALFGGWGLVRWLREHRARQGWLVGLAVAVAVVHLLARLGATHVDIRKHVTESPPSWPGAQTPGPAATPAPHGARGTVPR